jgi:hypothetical protein
MKNVRLKIIDRKERGPARMTKRATQNNATPVVKASGHGMISKKGGGPKNACPISHIFTCPDDELVGLQRST